MEQHVFAEQCSVSRADDQVAMVVTVAAGELLKIDPREELKVLVVFAEPAGATRTRRALGKAIDDASAAKARKGEHEVENRGPRR